MDTSAENRARSAAARPVEVASCDEPSRASNRRFGSSGSSDDTSPTCTRSNICIEDSRARSTSRWLGSTMAASPKSWAASRRRTSASRYAIVPTICSNRIVPPSRMNSPQPTSTSASFFSVYSAITQEIEPIGVPLPPRLQASTSDHHSGSAGRPRPGDVLHDGNHRGGHGDVVHDGAGDRGKHADEHQRSARMTVAPRHVHDVLGQPLQRPGRLDAADDQKQAHEEQDHRSSSPC